MDNARPLNLTAAEVRATLAGEPVVKYRKVTPQPGPEYIALGINEIDGVSKAVFHIRDYGNNILIRCPFGPVGQRFWVREAWFAMDEGPIVRYAANYQDLPKSIISPARELPREYSRITLTLTSIAVVNRDGWRWVGTFEVTA